VRYIAFVGIFPPLREDLSLLMKHLSEYSFDERIHGVILLLLEVAVPVVLPHMARIALIAK